MEGFECGVVSAGTEGGHVENVTDLHSATIDTAMSLELAAVEVVGRKPDECGDLLAAHLSSSGNKAISVNASTGPTPGIEMSI